MLNYTVATGATSMSMCAKRHKDSCFETKSMPSIDQARSCRLKGASGAARTGSGWVGLEGLPTVAGLLRMSPTMIAIPSSMCFQLWEFARFGAPRSASCD